MLLLWYRRVASSPSRGEILEALRSAKIHRAPKSCRSRASTCGVGFSTAARLSLSRSGHGVGLRFIVFVPPHPASGPGKTVQSLSPIGRPPSPPSHILPRAKFSGGTPHRQQNTLVATTDVVAECLF